MIARAFSSATGAMVVTAGLLLVMQILIATGQHVIGEPRVRHDLRPTKVRNDEEIVTRELPPARPTKPVVPPRTVIDGPEPQSGHGVRVPAPPPPGNPTTTLGINYGDGPLFNIFMVSPTYPTAALSRGLEGSVLVQYDVTTEGQVANVVVLESTHSIFEKVAIAAAYRFKYKPRTVDGVAYESHGLKNLFRFELED
ncbi:MAG: energy transducer TonB [Woeseiaceae bacterium]